MEQHSSILPALLGGAFLGLLLGVAGVIVRWLLAKRLPSALATIIGVITGAVVSTAVAGMASSQHPTVMVVTAAVLGGLMPYAATWRIFKVTDGPEENRPLSER